MIHLFKTCMITAFILGLTWSAPLRAQDQRYISIRNTDTIWLPGNICAYQFRLDNGGNDEGFGPLTITLQLKDKYGQTLVTRKMETEAFGDSNATRTTDAFLETECVEMSPQPKSSKQLKKVTAIVSVCRYRFSIPRTTIHC